MGDLPLGGAGWRHPFGTIFEKQVFFWLSACGVVSEGRVLGVFGRGGRELIFVRPLLASDRWEAGDGGTTDLEFVEVTKDQESLGRTVNKDGTGSRDRRTTPSQGGAARPVLQRVSSARAMVYEPIPTGTSANAVCWQGPPQAAPIAIAAVLGDYSPCREKNLGSFSIRSATRGVQQAPASGAAVALAPPRVRASHLRSAPAARSVCAPSRAIEPESNSGCRKRGVPTRFGLWLQEKWVRRIELWGSRQNRAVAAGKVGFTQESSSGCRKSVAHRIEPESRSGCRKSGVHTRIGLCLQEKWVRWSWPSWAPGPPRGLADHTFISRCRGVPGPLGPPGGSQITPLFRGVVLFLGLWAPQGARRSLLLSKVTWHH